MTLLWLVAAWLVGIIAASHAEHIGVAWLVIAAAGLIGLLVTRRALGWRLLFACALAFGLGAARLGLSRPVISETELAYYNDRGAAELTGIIIDAPDVRDQTVHLRVEMEAIRDGKTERPISGLALVEAQRFGGYSYGDRLRIYGEPQTPPSFDTFSYADYLARGGVYTFMLNPKVSITAHGQGSPLLAVSFDLRERAHQLIGQLIPSPQSALLTGILLGINTDIPPEISSSFNQTGTTHIIAISGSNITIVAGLLFVIFGRLRDQRLSALMMLIGLVIYTFFVGASASVVRAAIMGGLTIIAARLGRQNDGLTALAFAVWLQTLINPLVITDVGLILSAGATLGLILFTEPLTTLAERVLKRLFSAESAKLAVGILSDAVLVTLAAQLTTLPIIFLIFGRFSAISFAINMLVIPAQASIMSLGILSVALSAILFPVGQIVAWLVWLPLTYTLAIIRAGAQLPNASVGVSVEPGWVVAYYVILIGALVFCNRPTEQRTTWLARTRRVMTTSALATLGLAVAALLWVMVLSRPDGKLYVWFLDVGGNAVLIRTPNGAHILIDGGPNPTQLRTALGDRLPFYQRDLDMLIVTQPKTSTIAALPPLFGRYHVQTLLTNGQTASDATYRAFSSALAGSNTQLIAVTAGYQVQTSDGVTISVLHPQEAPATDAKAEDVPLVLRVAYRDVSFLLAPDLSEQAEQEMIGAGWYTQAAVVQLPTHASDTANGDAFLKATAPQVAVVEAVAGSRTGQPADTVFKRLGNTPVYRTDQQGTVEMVSDGEALWVSTKH